MDGPKYKALAKRLHIQAYPTILYLRDGEMREYAAGRTVSGLYGFIWVLRFHTIHPVHAVHTVCSLWFKVKDYV